MSRIKSSNSNYQSLYLWVSFLLGMISLGIVFWNRRETSFIPVMPEGSRRAVHENMEALQPCGLDSCLPAGMTYSGFASSLALSALTYQQTQNTLASSLNLLITFICLTQGQTLPALKINLDNLKAGEGFVFTGGQYTGCDTYAADVNGDNKTDLLIGGYGAARVYLVYGPNFPNMINLNNLNSSQGVVFSGDQLTGYDVYASDINDDGKIDIVVGAPGFGKIYVVYGPNFVNPTNLDVMNKTQGLIFTGGTYASASHAFEDVNNDGKKDLLFGAYGSNKAYVVFGPNFTTNTNLDNLNSSQGIIFRGGSGAGLDLCAADFNKDKQMDLLIGAYAANTAYLVYGPNFSNATNLEALTPAQGVIFRGGSYTGYTTAGEDINGDLNLDILLGGYGSNKGYVIYGPNFTNASNLDNLNDNQGLIFTGASGTGVAVYSADMNDDGNKDLLIGASLSATLYLVFGPNFTNVTNLENLKEKQGVVFTGSSRTGYSFYAADINNDGKLDLLIGGYYANTVYVVYNHVFNIFPPPTTKMSTTVTESESATSQVIVATTETSTSSVSTKSTMSSMWSTPTFISSVTSLALSITNATTSNSTINTFVSPSSLTEKQKSLEKDNTVLYAGIGGAVGGVALLLGSIGLFACYQKRKNKQAPNPNNAIPLRNESIRSQGQNNIYTAAPLMSGEGNSERPSLARPDYIQIDEMKKNEKEYDRMPKLEI